MPAGRSGRSGRQRNCAVARGGTRGGRRAGFRRRRSLRLRRSTVPRPEPDFNLSPNVARAEVRVVRLARHVSHALRRFEQRRRLLAERDLRRPPWFRTGLGWADLRHRSTAPGCAGSAGSRCRARGRRRTRHDALVDRQRLRRRRISSPLPRFHCRPHSDPAPSRSPALPQLRMVRMNTRGSSPKAS